MNTDRNTEKDVFYKGAPPQVLTIAGSDSGGGAGIQADLKTMTVHNTYGMSVVTAVTAQNTMGVQAVEVLPPEFVEEQLESVFSDLSPAAAKTGMLASAGITSAVADKLEEYDLPHLVVDPVMVATSGDLLLEEEAVSVLRDRLLPKATVITPNFQEALVLLHGPEAAGETEEEIEKRSVLEELTRRLHELGPDAVLVKGGHLEEDVARDVLFTGEEIEEYTAPRLSRGNTHGTGCTYSAAIAANLARGFDLKKAIGHAKTYITDAIREGFTLGAGINPVNHLIRPEGGDGL